MEFNPYDSACLVDATLAQIIGNGRLWGSGCYLNGDRPRFSSGHGSLPPIHNSRCADNRPVRWVKGDEVVEMAFDRMGRRVAKNNQRFVYDGYLQIADNGGNAYVWDATENVATRPLVWRRASSVAYYAHDGNKNVSDVVASNGTVVAHYDYAPFGAVIAQSGALASANPFGFSSEYADRDLGLVYYNYRHYDPVTGRWLSRDPIYEIENQDSSVLCGYCFINNSVNSNYDLLGLRLGPLFRPMPSPPPRPRPNYFTPAVGLEVATRAAMEALDHCDRCPGGEKACLKCCNAAALSAHLAQTAAAVLANAQCMKYGPFGMLACAALVDLTLHEQGNAINDKHRKCGMRCIFGK